MTYSQLIKSHRDNEEHSLKHQKKTLTVLGFVSAIFFWSYLSETPGDNASQQESDYTNRLREQKKILQKEDFEQVEAEEEKIRNFSNLLLNDDICYFARKWDSDWKFFEDNKTKIFFLQKNPKTTLTNTEWKFLNEYYTGFIKTGKIEHVPENFSDTILILKQLYSFFQEIKKDHPNVLPYREQLEALAKNHPENGYYNLILLSLYSNLPDTKKLSDEQFDKLINSKEFFPPEYQVTRLLYDKALITPSSRLFALNASILNLHELKNMGLNQFLEDRQKLEQIEKFATRLQHSYKKLTGVDFDLAATLYSVGFYMKRNARRKLGKTIESFDPIAGGRLPTPNVMQEEYDALNEITDKDLYKVEYDRLSKREQEYLDALRSKPEYTDPYSLLLKESCDRSLMDQDFDNFRANLDYPLHLDNLIRNRNLKLLYNVSKGQE